jgi:hypothetical protein
MVPCAATARFFAGTIEGERESGQEFSEIPGAAVRSRINAALALPIYSRAAVGSVGEGLFPTESASTQTSFKLTHRLTDSHELMARYAFSSAHIDREVLGDDNFSEQSARGSSRNRDQSFAAGWQAVN